MIKIGLTGGIACGKTIVSKVFEQLGIATYNADMRAKILIQENQTVKEQLIKTFGETIYNADGTLDKKNFGNIIFNDATALEKSNSIVHPAVRKDYDCWCEVHDNDIYTLKETAILFESGNDKFMEFVITVVAPLEERIVRIKKRDFLTDTQIMARIEKQMSDEYRIAHSDFVIYNSSTDMIIPQIIEIDKILRAKSKSL